MIAVIGRPGKGCSEARDAFGADVQALASGTAPAPVVVPSWLAGWWKVIEDGEVQYYLFSSDGSVQWTDRQPASRNAGMVGARNSGRFVITSKGAKITWNEAGGMCTVEDFTKYSVTKMKGTSNRWGPLDATRM